MFGGVALVRFRFAGFSLFGVGLSRVRLGLFRISGLRVVVLEVNARSSLWRARIGTFAATADESHHSDCTRNREFQHNFDICPYFM